MTCWTVSWIRGPAHTVCGFVRLINHTAVAGEKGDEGRGKWKRTRYGHLPALVLHILRDFLLHIGGSFVIADALARFERALRVGVRCGLRAVDAEL